MSKGRSEEAASSTAVATTPSVLVAASGKAEMKLGLLIWTIVIDHAQSKQKQQHLLGSEWHYLGPFPVGKVLYADNDQKTISGSS